MKGHSLNLWTYTHSSIGNCLSFMIKVVATSPPSCFLEMLQMSGGLHFYHKTKAIAYGAVCISPQV
jgi:hypothetical protein